MQHVPPGGAVKRRFLHTGKSHHWQEDQPGQRGSLKASGEHSHWFLEGQLERDLQVVGVAARLLGSFDGMEPGGPELTVRK